MVMLKVLSFAGLASNLFIRVPSQVQTDISGKHTAANTAAITATDEREWLGAYSVIAERAIAHVFGFTH